MVQSRRNFLMRMGMITAAAEAWPQTRGGRGATPSSEAPEPFTIAPTPDEAPALPPADGPWKKLRAVQQKKVIDFNAHNWETPTQGDNEEHAQMRGQRIVTDFTASLSSRWTDWGLPKPTYPFWGRGPRTLQR